MKIWAAVMVFAIGILLALVAYNGYRLSLPRSFIAVWVLLSGTSLILVPVLLLWAEGTDPYNQAERYRRQMIGLRRGLRMYAKGFNDGGEFARMLLDKAPEPKIIELEKRA